MGVRGGAGLVPLIVRSCGGGGRPANLVQERRLRCADEAKADELRGEQATVQSRQRLRRRQEGEGEKGQAARGTCSCSCTCAHAQVHVHVRPYMRMYVSMHMSMSMYMNMCEEERAQGADLSARPDDASSEGRHGIV